MTAFYGATTIKRDRLSNAGKEELENAIYTYVNGQNPITVRGVFYAMSVQGRVPKNDKGYRRVQQRVLEMRRGGRLPYGWIADSTRWQRKPDTQVGLRQMLNDTARFYRRDIWDEQGVYVEVWCEKDALAGVITEATAEWHVPLMVSRGFSSDTYLHDAAEQIERRNKPAFVYLFTDWDAAGENIDAKIREGFRRFAPDAEINFVRGALTETQVRDWNLPTRDPKPHDVKAGFSECCELDAIPPRSLIDLVETRIVQHLDLEAYQRLQVVEAAERESLQLLSRNWPAALAACS